MELKSNKNKKSFVAIDLGASSGRVIVANDDNLDEVYRFNGYLLKANNHLTWDVDGIYKNIIIGLKKAVNKYKNIVSLSIDSWGVDYVLLNNDKRIDPVYSYRDNRVDEVIDEVHKNISFAELYKHTGIQYQKFNTIYQLVWDLKNNRLKEATDFLHIPEYFVYLLTGEKIKEYTMASTTGLLNLNSGDFDEDIITRLNLPKHLFTKLNKPGTYVGSLKKEIIDEIGTDIPVILSASHDTASAFEAVDDDKDDSIILSSGTWSLMGVKVIRGYNNEKCFNANFTNEGGVNYIRFLKNIPGMWLVNEVARLDKFSFKDIDAMVAFSKYDEIFDVNDQSLFSPSNMRLAIINLLKKNPPKKEGDLYRSIYRSLAHSYLNTCNELEDILGKKFNTIYVIGGGSKNILLNSFISEITGRNVYALSREATALGNIKVQKRREENAN